MQFDKIADWSQADLRRFVVNLLLSDPGALPKEVSGPSQQLPSGATDGSVPVWDSASNKWVTSVEHPVPASDLASYPNDASKFLNGVGAWLGGLSMLFDTTLSGSAASVDTGASAIPATHKHLFLMTQLRSDRAVTAEDSSLRFGTGGGAVDSGNNYSWTQIPIASGAITGSQSLATSGALYGVSAAASSTAGIFSAAFVLIMNYTVARRKHYIGFGGLGSNSGRVATGEWNNTGSIDRIAAIPSVGPNYIAGSRMTIYGIG